MSKKKNRWELFREDLIELDGRSCVRWGKGSKDGAVLQVHHKQYIPGRLPWDYPYGLCETLCRGCHAAEHGIIPPKVGWQYLGDEDLEDLCGQCEYCGNEIRYVFYVSHPKWPSLGVGTVCCDSLTETQLASNHMESIRRYAVRKARFIGSSRWKQKESGLSIQQKGIIVDIRPISSSYVIVMDGHQGRKSFGTLDKANGALSGETVMALTHAKELRNLLVHRISEFLPLKLATKLGPGDAFQELWTTGDLFKGLAAEIHECTMLCTELRGISRQRVLKAAVNAWRRASALDRLETPARPA